MKAFLVVLENRPGKLARVSEAIADRGVNITAISGITIGTQGAVALMTSDEAATRDAFRDAGIDVRELEVIAVTLPNRPGILARTARRLEDKSVNVELLLPTAMSARTVRCVIAVDNVEAARDALGDLGDSD